VVTGNGTLVTAKKTKKEKRKHYNLILWSLYGETIALWYDVHIDKCYHFHNA
jgi:hypothetical protein